MRKFRLFIFNSDTWRIDWTDPAWKPAGATFLLALSILVGAELATRLVLAKHGRGWEYWHPVAARKFDFIRERIESRRAISTLVVGDSTGARDIDPQAIEQQTGPTSWNGAWSGNFPLAFEQTTLPLLEDQRLQVQFVVASFIPSGFTGGDDVTPSEASILASPYVQRRSVRWLTGDYSYLSRLRTAWPFLVGDERPGSASVRRYGFEPDESTADLEVVSRNESAAPQTSLSERRISVMRRLISLAVERHFTLVVMVPPTLEKRRVQAAHDYMTYLAHEEKEGRLTVFNYMQAPFIGAEHFSDRNHLNAGGARLLSTDIGRRLRALGKHAYRAPHDDRQVPVMDGR